MKTIELDNTLVIQHCDDVEMPVMIHLYPKPNYREANFPVEEVRMAIQIFHTDLKYFDLRKAALIDPDERRPVYGFVFDDREKQIAFLLKRLKYIMAYQQIELIDINGAIMLGAVRNFGTSLYRLRSFQSWMEHLSGRSGEGTYTNDCEVTVLEGSSMLHVPEITIDDLIACLKGEKVLVKDSQKCVEGEKGMTVDGVKLEPADIPTHFTRKAMLERMETCTAN